MPMKIGELVSLLEERLIEAVGGDTVECYLEFDEASIECERSVGVTSDYIGEFKLAYTISIEMIEGEVPQTGEKSFTEIARLIEDIVNDELSGGLRGRLSTVLCAAFESLEGVVCSSCAAGGGVHYTDCSVFMGGDSTVGTVRVVTDYFCCGNTYTITALVNVLADLTDEAKRELERLSGGQRE